MEHKNIYQLVLAGVLCAIGLVVPMVMPKVIIGPMSFTLGAHVAIFLAMFISPKVAAAVCLGTTMGFFCNHTPNYRCACSNPYHFRSGRCINY